MKETLSRLRLSIRKDVDILALYNKIKDKTVWTAAHIHLSSSSKLENYAQTAQTCNHVYKSYSTEAHNIYLTLKC